MTADDGDDELDGAVRPLQRTLADLLRSLRAAAGLSQGQLGYRINYSRSTVGAVELCTRYSSPRFWANCDHVLGAGAGSSRRTTNSPTPVSSANTNALENATPNTPPHSPRRGLRWGWSRTGRRRC
jgi:hypothetical protein